MCTPTAALFFSIFFVTVRAIDIYAKKRERERERGEEKLNETMAYRYENERDIYMARSTSLASVFYICIY
jgi:hypothetical protein